MGLWITGIVMKEIYEKYEKFSKTLSNATNNYARYKKMPKIVTIIIFIMMIIGPLQFILALDSAIVDSAAGAIYHATFGIVNFVLLYGLLGKRELIWKFTILTGFYVINISFYLWNSAPSAPTAIMELSELFLYVGLLYCLNMHSVKIYFRKNIPSDILKPKGAVYPTRSVADDDDNNNKKHSHKVEQKSSSSSVSPRKKNSGLSKPTKAFLLPISGGIIGTILLYLIAIGLSGGGNAPTEPSSQINISSSDVDTLTNKGNALHNLGNYTQAIQYYESFSYRS